jgi:hypothetical protein
MLARRTNVAADVDYLVRVIDEARALPPDKVVDFVDAKIATLQRVDAPQKRTAYTGNVAILLRADADSPARFATDVEPERARLVKLGADLRNSIR